MADLPGTDPAAEPQITEAWHARQMTTRARATRVGIAAKSSSRLAHFPRHSAMPFSAAFARCVGRSDVVPKVNGGVAIMGLHYRRRRCQASGRHGSGFREARQPTRFGVDLGANTQAGQTRQAYVAPLEWYVERRQEKQQHSVGLAITAAPV